MKQCTHCKIKKSLHLFYTHHGTKDGYLGQCKNCVKKRVKNNYYKNHQQRLKYERKRSKNPERRKKHYEYVKKARAKQKGKYRARRKINNSIRDGKIKRQPCIVCGNKKSEAHHQDYRKPFDVIWLCQKHHRKLHSLNGIVWPIFETGLLPK